MKKLFAAAAAAAALTASTLTAGAASASTTAHPVTHDTYKCVRVHHTNVCDLKATITGKMPRGFTVQAFSAKRGGDIMDYVASDAACAHYVNGILQPAVPNPMATAPKALTLPARVARYNYVPSNEKLVCSWVVSAPASQPQPYMYVAFTR